MKKTLKILAVTWILLMVLAILFKIKLFVEIFPIVGLIFVILLFIYTIQQISLESRQKKIDKKNKNT